MLALSVDEILGSIGHCDGRLSPEAGPGMCMAKYRNRYFLVGILLVLLGIQFRMIDSFVLNESTTRVLAKVTKTEIVADNSTFGSFVSAFTPAPTKRVTPPRWTGLAMIAAGAVICFHAFSIPKQGDGASS